MRFSRRVTETPPYLFHVIDEKRKELWGEISKHFTEGESLKSKAQAKLGPDDPVVNKLKTALSVYKNAVNDIASFIEKGKIIENFDIEM